ncbi:NUDIX hydrolase [Plantibacter sp. YIM 135249]|uniref:NUDIX hydrolase n=1 Tax=Plantibacter sp. YIM 135249 TaxID=3423918 RepID=UPI003D32594D
MRATTATDLPEDHWTTINETLVHDGRVKIVDHEVALPDGTRTRYEVDASVSFAVAVLLVLPGDEIVLTRQYRYPIDQWILDLPAGGGNAGEDPRDAAIRECEEETGLVPIRIEPLHTFFPNPGRSSWPVHLFIGFGAEPGSPDLSDPSEQVRVVRMPVADLDERIRAGEIVDPTLLIARLMAGARGYLP